MSGGVARKPQEAAGVATGARARHAALLGACLALNLFLVARVPLAADEAYYWVWSLRPGLSYYDHPPLIAWLIAASTALCGHTPLGVRLPAVLCAWGAAGVLWALARQVGASGSTALLSAVALPVFLAGAVVSTQDTPLAFFSALALYCFQRLLGGDGRRWAAAGFLAAGMACLAKYTGVLTLAAFAVVLIVERRDLLRRGWLWAAAPLAALPLVPVLVWNAGHGWVSILFQLGHGLGRTKRWTPLWVLEYVGGQLAVATPFLFAAFLIAAWRLRRARDLALIRAAFLVPLGLFLLASLRRRGEANWPAAGYLAATVLLAAALARGEAPRVLGRLRVAGTALGLGAAALLFAQAIWAPLPLPPRLDPTARLRGWPELAAGVRGAMAGENLPVFTETYQTASLLNFYAFRSLRARPLPGASRVTQYDYWDDTALPPEGEFLAAWRVEKAPWLQERHDCRMLARVGDSAPVPRPMLVLRCIPRPPG